MHHPTDVNTFVKSNVFFLAEPWADLLIRSSSHSLIWISNCQFLKVLHSSGTWEHWWWQIATTAWLFLCLKLYYEGSVNEGLRSFAVISAGMHSCGSRSTDNFQCIVTVKSVVWIQYVTLLNVAPVLMETITGVGSGDGEGRVSMDIHLVSSLGARHLSTWSASSTLWRACLAAHQDVPTRGFLRTTGLGWCACRIATSGVHFLGIIHR